MENKQKVGWLTIFSVVSVWFGAHAGGGFASGNQEMNFFVQYGWPAVFTPILSMLILAIVYRIIVIMCNQHGITNYSDWSQKLYEPHQKILSPIFEICNLGAGMLATSASVAGAAAIIQEMLHFPYMLSVIVLTILVVVLSMFGAKLISRASSVLTILIMISVVIIAGVGLAHSGGNISVDVANHYAPKGIIRPIWMAITYASFQIFSLLGTYGVATQLKTEKACNKAAVLGCIINAVMLTLLTVLCLAYRKDVTGNTLPILTICKSLGNPILTVLYTVSLFCAFVSTAVSVVFGTVMRFEKFHTKWNLNKTLWDAIIGVIIVAISMFAASFGLTAIVAVGYSYLGVIGIFLVALPAIIVGIKKIRAFRASGQPMAYEKAEFEDAIEDSKSSKV